MQDDEMDKSYSELSVYQSNQENEIEVASGRASALLLLTTACVIEACPT